MEEQQDDFVPRLGKEFQTVDEAWSAWRDYGERIGFGVRLSYGHKNIKDDIITSKLFLCSCEGKRGVDKRDHLTKKPRAETRTGCQARLKIKLDKETQKYKVVEFVSDHNHPLQQPTCYLIPSQPKIPEIADIGIHSADSLGVQKQVMKYGSAIAMMKYFEKHALEDPSFKHFEDTTEEGEIANVIWTHAKMIVAYARFGDVVEFDTLFGTNNEKWAFGIFVGFNHFREIVIFGAALMCDQSKESFEWVFTKFLEAHGGKKPITIFTKQNCSMEHALEKVMPDTRHGLCMWHIEQNCVKYLSRFNKDGIDITGDFKACMYRYEEEKEFEDAFNALRGKLNGREKWLEIIYDSRKKWAHCFMKNAYTLGILCAQASVSISSNLKAYLNCKLDICRFLEYFDRDLDENHEREIKSESDMASKLPRLKLNVPILREARKLYTPKVFELFQAEFELSGSAYIEGLEGDTYTVAMCDIDNETPHKSGQVVWTREDQTVSCSCKKFEREGILCWHALKVLNREDIKVIPPRYVLNRWTKVAKDVIVVDLEGRRVIEDPLLDVRNRNADLVRILTPICGKAAQNEEQSQFLRNELLAVQQKYEEKYENLPM
ncbi:Protein FAR1-RELATED SEQUENCE 5 [Rhynchospora pubera]|uniref:Protein FAR1-RELATED SEQUENCE 5 n=1 Tax=Rhynchospora pubera TaxID=906938 RepID=A0AAV8DCU8_9POAL|nr:Protein FAR1-RELATED SEQUENCE 5 [Rhynchospora pubera]